MSDTLVDLRVDDHEAPLSELRRLYGLHEGLFGKTPRDTWIRVDDELAAELRERLAALGYEGNLAETFPAWAGKENLEERVDGIEQHRPRRAGGIEGGEMTDKGYDVAHIDELEELPINKGEFVWRPVRRRFGITAFGTNAYTANAGQRVVEEHTESGGHQELYVVLRGRATFTLDGEEIDAPAGTLVFVQPGTKRGAIAAEDGTAVLGVGAKPGEVFEPSPWEDSFAAGSYADLGQVEKAREIMDAALAARPDDWRAHYNYACLLALNDEPEAAITELQRAYELEPKEVGDYAGRDSDLDSIRDDPRVSAIAGQADAGGESA